MTKKTRAELVEGLSLLQINRLEHGWDKNYLAKKYWVYHDKNAKLSTQRLKYRITKEVMWKAQSNRI